MSRLLQKRDFKGLCHYHSKGRGPAQQSFFSYDLDYTTGFLKVFVIIIPKEGAPPAHLSFCMTWAIQQGSVKTADYKSIFCVILKEGLAGHHPSVLLLL